jgi:hypothetical protein
MMKRAPADLLACFAVWCVLLGPGARGAASQEPTPAAPSRADTTKSEGAVLLDSLISAYENFDFAKTRELSLRLLQPEVAATTSERAEATFFAASTSLLATPPDRAEARRLMSRGIRLDIFARPDTTRFSAELLLEYERARRSLFAIGLRSQPADTSLPLDGAILSFEVGATRPATLNVTLESTRRTTFQLATSVRIVGLGRVRTAFAQDGQFLPTGSYTLKIEATDDSAGARTQLTVPVGIVADSVPVLPLPSPLAADAFRPERRPRGPAVLSLLWGIGAGVLTALAPRLLNPPALASIGKGEGVAVAVGGAVALTGLVTLLAQHPGSTIPANVGYNAGVRDTWETERARVMAENARRRTDARIRIEFGQASQ